MFLGYSNINPIFTTLNESLYLFKNIGNIVQIKTMILVDLTAHFQVNILYKFLLKS